MDAEVFFRGPGLIMVLAGAFAVSYLLYIVRRYLPMLILIGIGGIVPFDPALGVTLWLLAVLFGGAFMLLRAEFRRLRPAKSYAWREVGEGERAMSRSEVMAEFTAWNAAIERAVIVLKELPTVPDCRKRHIQALGEEAGDLRETLLGELRRLRKLRLAFNDPAEAERMERVFATVAPLAQELWTASQDPAGYKRAVSDRAALRQS